MKHIKHLLILFISFALFAQPSFKATKQKSGFFPDMNSGLSKESDSKVSKPYEEYRTHRAGLLWMPVSNIGNFGNPFFYVNDPCTNKRLPMGEMPGGSGMNYIYNGALWCGGYLDSAEVSINGVNSKLFQGPLVSTAYFITSEFWPIDLKNDPSGLILGRLKESSSIEGKINCLFEDVYNPKATADEQFDTYYSDKYTVEAYTGIDRDDKRPHIPLGIEVKQSSYTWTAEFAKKFIIIDYTIYNYNEQQKDIYDFFLGMYLDSDVGFVNYSEYNSLPDDYFAQLWLSEDDLCGFIEKWDNYIDPATGERKTVDMNLAWSADNDGREYVTNMEGEVVWDAPAGTSLFGATGIATFKVLRTPNPDLKYSFNIFMPGQNHDYNIDWGPHWKTGFHSDWQYDLTPMQKGYDDTNYDSLRTWSDTPLYNGRVEGTPIQDRGKYMVMSNDEFDYNQTAIREVYLGMDTQTDGTPIPQPGKWQPWIVDGTEGVGEVADGPIFDMNNYANGMDERFVVSFGPLGYETYENIAVDSDRDGTLDDYKNKKVWKFAYGDSLKLTIAFIASENFHTSVEQSADCDYEVVDLSDGLDPSLFDQGWYDTFYNVMWSTRLYDTPLWDTPVKKWGTTKKDGWFGEDVGADGIFNDILGEKCWWTDVLYLREDEGEGDLKMTNFTNEVTDMYGNSATSEDNLLPFGRQHEDVGFGITGSRDTGEGYGYMVKYTKHDGVYPQGSWVRYGFDNGMLDPGDGVPDFQAPPPPYSPKITVSYADNDVVIEWSSHEFYNENGKITVSGPEHTIDPFSRRKDFESYQIQVSPTVFAGDYTEIFSVDIDNYAYENVSATLEYLNDPVPTDTIAAHPEDYPAIKTVYGKIYQLMPYGDNRNMHISYNNPGLFSYTATADSSTAEEYGIIWNYKFVLHNQSYAEQKYIAVTSSDHGDAKSGTPSQRSSPFVNGTSIIPSKITGTDEVIVVPNPYRGDVDYQDMGWENINSAHEWSESDRKIVFLNIPLRCVIRIYTLAGDLCKVITHNGNAKSDVLYQYGENGAYWNLLNDNRQAVVSGIYLFSVQDVDNKKSDFVGKFVIIK